MPRWFALFSLFALFPSAAAARPLSLDEAIAIAVRDHPDVIESGLLSDQASARVSAARAAWDPDLVASIEANQRRSSGFVAGYASSSDSSGWTGSVGLEGETPVGTSWSVSSRLDRDVSSTLAALGGPDAQAQEQSTWGTGVDLSIRQDLLAFLRSSQQRIEVRQATERLEQSELSVLRAVEASVVEVADAWWSWWSAVEAVGVSGRSLEQAELLLAQTEAWHAVGEVAQLEVSRVKAERLSAEGELWRAEVEARTRAGQLLTLLNSDPTAPIEPAGPERIELGALPEAEEALAAVRDGNLELAAARLDLGYAQRGREDAGEQRLPTLDLSATAGIGTLADDTGLAFSELGTDQNNPYYTVGVGLTVPLGGRAAKAARTEAEAQVALNSLALSSRTRALEADALSAVDAIQTGTRGVVLAEALLEVARATEAGERARVAEGVRRFDQVLEVVREREAAEIDLLSARVELARAELELARLQGRVLAEVLDVE